MSRCEDLLSDGQRQLEMLMLDDAIDKLAVLDERAARVAEMRLFGAIPCIAAVLDAGADEKGTNEWLATEGIVDPDRVALCGQSMGSRGAMSMANAYPAMFSSVTV